MAAFHFGILGSTAASGNADDILATPVGFVFQAFVYHLEVGVRNAS